MKISDKQARELGYAFAPDIAEYIRNHEAEYRAYLLATEQTDKNYPPVVAEGTAADA